MALPKALDFYDPVMRALQDGNVHDIQDISSFVQKEMNLSESDIAEQKSSGGETKFINRVNWAISGLRRAGLIENLSPRKGKYQITTEGIKAIKSGNTIDHNFLLQYQAYEEYKKPKKQDKNNSSAQKDNNGNALEAEGAKSVQYWLYSPGNNAKYWDYCLQNGIMVHGCDELGNLSQYKTKEEIIDYLSQTEQYADKKPNVEALTAWQFFKTMQLGDVVFVKNGRKTIIGRGIIESDYSYNSSRNEYNNERKVNWTHHGNWKYPMNSLAPMRALTEISDDQEKIERLEALFSETESNEEKWIPINYDPGISIEKWKELLSDEEVFNDSAKRIMKRIRDYGGQATCTQLSKKYGGPKNLYLSGSVAFAKKVADKTDCPIANRPDGSPMWWAVLYYGRDANDGEDGSFIWKVRDNLQAALDDFDFSDIPLYEDQVDTNKKVENYSKLDFFKEVFMEEEQYGKLVRILEKKQNVILQGSPGVGKTFAAKRLAWAMMGKKDNSRIKIVQFHQNYSYEDFVKGYRPNEDGSFSLKPGVFYEFCKKAEKDKLYMS